MYLFILGIVRRQKEVENFLIKIRDQYHKVRDTLNGTGAGILESNGEQGLRDWTLKKCPFFYELEAVLGDKAGSEAWCTNESADYGYIAPEDYTKAWRVMKKMAKEKKDDSSASDSDEVKAVEVDNFNETQTVVLAQCDTSPESLIDLQAHQTQNQNDKEEWDLNTATASFSSSKLSSKSITSSTVSSRFPDVPTHLYRNKSDDLYEADPDFETPTHVQESRVKRIREGRKVVAERLRMLDDEDDKNEDSTVASGRDDSTLSRKTKKRNNITPLDSSTKKKKKTKAIGPVAANSLVTKQVKQRKTVMEERNATAYLSNINNSRSSMESLRRQELEFRIRKEKRELELAEKHQSLQERQYQVDYNRSILQMRIDYKKTDPDASVEKLDVLFPLMAMQVALQPLPSQPPTATQYTELISNKKEKRDYSLFLSSSDDE